MNQAIESNYYRTKYGKIILDDSLEAMLSIADESVDLIMTSPPFGLVRKKEYGNVDADKYINWFKPFASHFYRILKNNGSLIIDIGGSWIPGQPTRSLYHFELLIMLCKEFNFNLSQEFYWWNPSKLPTPAEWVNIRRIRVKDAINCVWWLSKTPWPKANNKKVLIPYSASMKGLLKNGYKSKMRPSGHDISDKFCIDNGASIPPNLIAIANTESNSSYMIKCKEAEIKPHPARFPTELPEYFIRMLTNKGDLVVDPFAGSCVTGEAAEKLRRKWICIELEKEYVEGAKLRFPINKSKATKREIVYSIHHPSTLWDDTEGSEIVSEDGGKNRKKKEKKAYARS